MTIDCVALMDRRSAHADGPWLASRLAELTTQPTPIAALARRYRQRWAAKAWSWSPRIWESYDDEDVSALEYVEVIGPGGFWLNVFERSVELTHIMSFGRFTSDSGSRFLLRSLCRLIAELVGTDRVLITHEFMKMMYGGHSVAEAESWLRAEVGPPASTFDELRAADNYEARCWYLDTFAELPPWPHASRRRWWVAE